MFILYLFVKQTMPILKILYGLSETACVDLTTVFIKLFTNIDGAGEHVFEINASCDFNLFKGDPASGVEKTLFVYYSFTDAAESDGSEYYTKIRTELIPEHRTTKFRIDFSNPKQFFVDNAPTKNIIIFPHSKYQPDDGGINVMYYLASLIEQVDSGYTVRIYPTFGPIPSPIFNKYYTEGEFNKETATVIYCEGTVGNPLCSRFVVRWLLSQLGTNVPFHRKNTFGKHDLVYYFNSEIKMEQEPAKIGVVFKMLSLLFTNPMYRDLGLPTRAGWCFTFRKAELHHTSILKIHPRDAHELLRYENIEEYMQAFNRYKYFVSYDALTFHSINAALCGCVSIVYAIAGISKAQWIQKTALNEYFKNNPDEPLYGIAYGNEPSEIERATQTVGLVHEQWRKITDYYKVSHVQKFLNDLVTFGDNENTAQNNFGG